MLKDVSLQKLMRETVLIISSAFCEEKNMSRNK